MLSNFEITKFDNQLVITKKGDNLVFAKPIAQNKNTELRPYATIIKLKPKDEVEQILKDNEDPS